MPHIDESRGLIASLAAIPASSVADETHAASSKATPVDGDELPLVDSAASWGLKKLTWANLKTNIGNLINGGTLPASLTDLTVTDAGGGATLELASLKNSGGGANTKVKIGFYAASTPYASIIGGYGAAAPEMTFEVNATLAATLTSTGLAVVGDVSASGVLVGPGGASALVKATSALSNGSGAATGTLTNAPAAGNPTKWISIDDGGTIRKIPAW